MTQTRFRPLSTTLLAAAFALVLAAYFVVSASAQHRATSSPPVLLEPSGGMVILPRVSVIQWKDTVARFDSATGAIHRFSGNLHSPPLTATWVPAVPAVRERHSGMLRFQQPEGIEPALDAPFLVDVVTGETWILRAREAHPRWDKVEIAPR